MNKPSDTQLEVIANLIKEGFTSGHHIPGPPAEVLSWNLTVNMGEEEPPPPTLSELPDNHFFKN